MSMNIGSLDPRTIKELLQLQTINKAGLLSSNPAGSDGSDGDFAELLEG